MLDAIQGERFELRRDNVLYPWLKQGIDEAKFRASYNGFFQQHGAGKLPKQHRTMPSTQYRYSSSTAST